MFSIKVDNRFQVLQEPVILQKQIAHELISKNIFIPEDTRTLLDSRKCGWYVKASKIAFCIAYSPCIPFSVGMIATLLTERKCDLFTGFSDSLKKDILVDTLACVVSKGVQRIYPDVLEIPKNYPYLISVSVFGGGVAAMFAGALFHKRFTTAAETHRKNDEHLTLQATEKLKSFYDGIADSLKEGNDRNAALLLEELKHKMNAIHTALKAYGLKSEEITEKLEIQLKLEVL